MKKALYLILISVLILGIAGCSGVASNEKQSMEEKNGQGVFYELKQDEAKRNLDEDKNIILVDVRTPQEYEEVHIPGSMLIPLDTIESEAEDKLTDKDATIYVYCRSGNRSGTAARILADLGYKNVYNIGGIMTWPYETEKGSK